MLCFVQIIIIMPIGLLQMCERRLQVRGVLGSVEIKSVNFHLFPFDSDLMSMEVEHTFRVRIQLIYFYLVVIEVEMI